jgi:hypothetical protein
MIHRKQYLRFLQAQSRCKFNIYISTILNCYNVNTSDFKHNFILPENTV